jgi:hypothetical protein
MPHGKPDFRASTRRCSATSARPTSSRKPRRSRTRWRARGSTSVPVLRGRGTRLLQRHRSTRHLRPSGRRALVGSDRRVPALEPRIGRLTHALRRAQQGTASRPPGGGGEHVLQPEIVLAGRRDPRGSEGSDLGGLRPRAGYRARTADCRPRAPRARRGPGPGKGPGGHRQLGRRRWTRRERGDAIAALRHAYPVVGPPA